MDEKAKLTAILLGGYLLGRTKKAKLALTVAGLIGGRQLSSNKGELMGQVNELAKASPEVKKLREQITGKLADAAKSAAIAGATRGIESVNTNLQNRTQRLNDSNGASAQADDGQETGDETPEDEAEDTAEETSGKTTTSKSSSK
ncbi:hypothetical protein [Arthrobacter sp. H14]|uniref:hypothetical protein n=1 Tax=Arthrobacter sp. H14 TaxID=1312959 RepID=UPI00047D9C3C|nr:hypothetical protein [Arthrobacter sp. H14]